MSTENTVPGETGRRSRAWIGWTIGLVAVVAAAVAGQRLLPASAPEWPTVTVMRGDFVERLDIRGEIRPVKSVVIMAPGQVGDLLIVDLVKSGTTVEAGDKIATFNPVVLRQQIQDKRGELRQAEADIDRARANAKIQDDQNQTQLLRARFDVERAKLAMGSERLVARLEYERAKLDVDNAEQRLIEVEKRREAGQASQQADIASRSRQRDKVKDELDRLEMSLQAMDVFAPSAGTVHIGMNGRGGPNPNGMPSEFRQGDRVWSGASIAELPDLSSVFVRAQLDEDSRGRLQIGQPAIVKVDAIPDRELKASIVDISVLARVDIMVGFPPPRTFDLKVQVDEADPRLRPGMSSTARIEVDRLPNATIVPSSAVFDVNGRSVVYRLKGSSFVETPIEIAKRSREQVAVSSGVSPNDLIAAKKPPVTEIRTE